MWHAADIAEKARHAVSYQFKGTGVGEPKFDWTSFRHQRDAYIRRLNGIYDNNLVRDKVDQHRGWGRLISPTQVEVTGPNGDKYVLTSKQICIATGGAPSVPSEEQVPGANLGITSDGFFELDEQPKRVAVVGAGYIAVEIAGIFHALGSETHLLIRHDKVLRTFDETLQETLTNWMEHTGVKIHKNTNVAKVEGVKGQALTIHTAQGETIEVDCLLWAIGRHSLTQDIGLDKAGVKTDKHGNIIVDE